MIYHRTDHITLNLQQPKRDVYIAVESGVKDEVLDWGGTGRAVMLLAGAGVTARGFRSIVPELTKRYHVYSMTRRGYGNSSKPPYVAANYSASRLGQDVLAVLDALQIEKPVLIGHSIAGEELSYIGTHDPKRVAALIYLDSGYGYAYDGGVATPTPPSPPPHAPAEPLETALLNGMQHFTGPIDDPILAIFAHPHAVDAFDPKDDAFEAYAGEQIAAFKRGLPNAKVIVIPNANHFVYNSNTKEVLQDINAFIASLSS